MYCVARFEAGDDFLCVAIDDGNLTTIPKRDREEVLDVAVMLRFARTIFRRNQDVPAGKGPM